VDRDLNDLRHHWGSAYVVHHFWRPGLWLAQRRDTHETLKAEDPEQLRLLIREDYSAHPVSRDYAGLYREIPPSGSS